MDSRCYELPSHFELTPMCQIQPVTIRGAFPGHEDFRAGGVDAFGGKYFVRIPKMERGVPFGRTMRLKREPPRYGPEPFDSIWLPDHCIVSDNLLETTRLQWAKPRPSRVHSGLGMSTHA